MLDTKPCGLWLLMTIVYLGEREEGIVRETEAFMGGYVNNVWSKDGMREVGNARLKRRISRLEE